MGFFLIFCSGIYCQQQTGLDSLVSVYESGNYKKEDKLLILEKITWGYHDPEKILFFSDLLIQAAQAADSTDFLDRKSVV